MPHGKKLAHRIVFAKGGFLVERGSICSVWWGIQIYLKPKVGGGGGVVVDLLSNLCF